MAAAGPGSGRAFRNYADADQRVRELYRQNHEQQTLRFVLERKAAFLPPRRRRMGLWEAFDALARYVDASDPDLQLPQLEHAFQTAESLRAEGRSELWVLTGLVHDLGKLLHLFGEPQWAVVGDTFPVGCAFSDRIVHADLFAANPDRGVAAFSTACGIYAEGCGLDQVHLSWGHDEYLYGVLGPYLPEEPLYLIRYHSFQAAHREGAYGQLMDARDRRLMPAVREFARHDLYSKGASRPDPAQLRPYYEDLAARYLPDTLLW